MKRNNLGSRKSAMIVLSLQIDNHDTVEMGSDAEVKWISHLLELSQDWLKQALTQKVTVRTLSWKDLHMYTPATCAVG